jgi:16S rRNA (adenine1518-N6/adenine1519-N6)-dimethyltransferase
MSAQVQMLARVELVCHVGRRAFIPAPRVDSTVVRLLPFATSAEPVRDLGSYAAVVRAGFAQRRKMLRNSLAAQFGSAALAQLESTGIDLSRRAETLSLREFARLADALPDGIAATSK